MKPENLILREKVYKSVQVGLMALALVACASPIPESADAYYYPFTDTIVYKDGSEEDEQVVAHEEYHRQEAREMGRFKWGLLYTLDSEFRCASEVRANEAAGYEPLDHPACFEQSSKN